MNLVSLFLRFVKGQFKDDRVIYGFHKRIVAKRTDDFVENRKNRVQWCRNRLHWTIQEQWNNIIFLVKCGVNSKIISGFSKMTAPPVH
jgi:hypothetical protein